MLPTLDPSQSCPETSQGQKTGPSSRTGGQRTTHTGLQGTDAEPRDPVVLSLDKRDQEAHSERR